MNDRLRLLSGNEPLMLEPTDGWETLGQATDVFRYVDRNFERWNCNDVGPPTRETPVRVYEMARDSTFQELFGGFGVELDSLALTPFFCSKFATYILWQQRTSSRAVVSVCACAALLLREFSGHKSATVSW